VCWIGLTNAVNGHRSPVLQLLDDQYVALGLARLAKTTRGVLPSVGSLVVVGDSNWGAAKRPGQGKATPRPVETRDSLPVPLLRW